MIAIMTTVTIDFYSFVSTVERTTAEYPEYMEISVMGIRYTSGKRGNVCAVCRTRHFQISPLLYHGEKGEHDIKAAVVT